MKRAALVIVALAICGCGDDIEKNYYTVTQPAGGEFTNISTAAPPDLSEPDPVNPPVIDGTDRKSVV